MTGHHVVRRFGWDCHGLPVEYEIDKKLGKRGPHEYQAHLVPSEASICLDYLSQNTA